MATHRHHHHHRLPATERDAVELRDYHTELVTTLSVSHLYTPTQSRWSASSADSTGPFAHGQSALGAGFVGGITPGVLRRLDRSGNGRATRGGRQSSTAAFSDTSRASTSCSSAAKIPPVSSQSPTLLKRVLLLRLFLRPFHDDVHSNPISRRIIAIAPTISSHLPSRRYRLAAAGHFRVTSASVMSATRCAQPHPPRTSVECAVSLQILSDGYMMGRRHGPGLYIGSQFAPIPAQTRAGASSRRIVQLSLAHLGDPALVILALSGIPQTPFHHRPLTAQDKPILGRKTFAKLFLLSAAYPTWATALTSSVVTERPGRVGRCLQMLGRARTPAMLVDGSQESDDYARSLCVHPMRDRFASMAFRLDHLPRNYPK
ncbi:hypothetical protein C8F01DRAFT_1264406 [Mycena amicta]|nr:hypothetical protein C8F01DRAFT_1264406 [Mycena amicta]